MQTLSCGVMDGKIEGYREGYIERENEICINKRKGEANEREGNAV